MNPLVEVGGRVYKFGGDAEVRIEGDSSEEVIRVDDTPANRAGIDEFRNDRAMMSGEKPLIVRPDENGVVTYGSGKLPLPTGYERNTRISQVKILIKKNE